MVNLDYLYNPDAAKNAFSRNFFIDKKLSFSVIENGLILPHRDTSPGGLIGALGGIVDGNGDYVNSSFVKFSKTNRAYLPSEPIKRSDKTVIYFGFYYPVWGHVLTDNLRRIWFLESEVFKKEFKNCPIVYIPWFQSREGTDKNFRQLLEILGIDFDRFQPITQPTRFKKIILPDESFKGGFTKEYREMIDRFRNFALKNRTPTSIKKVYYFYGRHQIGEERLAEYFRSKGYEIISPEKLTLEEQFNLLINADSFASTLGSCAHNSIFLRDRTETIFIPRTANTFTFYQQILDQVNFLSPNYIDSTFSVFSVRHGLLCFIISEQLKRFFGDKFSGYEEEDFKTFLEYAKFVSGKGVTINSAQVKNYGVAFQDFIKQLKRHAALIKAYDIPQVWNNFQPSLKYRTNVHEKGWGLWQNENKISNPLYSKRDIQAIKINFPNHKIYYSVCLDDKESWSEEVESPTTAGAVGKNKSITGIKIRFDEESAEEFDILYRMHKFDGEWTPWAKNGEELLSGGVKLNAIQIKLENKT